MAPLTIARLVVGVDITTGTELEALLTTTAMLEGEGSWPSVLLLTWIVDVAIGTTVELVEEA